MFHFNDANIERCCIFISSSNFHWRHLVWFNMATLGCVATASVPVEAPFCAGRSRLWFFYHPPPLSELHTYILPVRGVSDWSTEIALSVKEGPHWRKIWALSIQAYCNVAWPDGSTLLCSSRKKKRPMNLRGIAREYYSPRMVDAYALHNELDLSESHSHRQ